MFIAGDEDDNTGYQDGTGEEARFDGPVGMAVDCDGIVIVADTGNHILRKVTRKGVVSTFAGCGRSSGFIDGMGQAARFYRPW